MVDIASNSSMTESLCPQARVREQNARAGMAGAGVRRESLEAQAAFLAALPTALTAAPVVLVTLASAISTTFLVALVTLS